MRIQEFGLARALRQTAPRERTHGADEKFLESRRRRDARQSAICFSETELMQ